MIYADDGDDEVHAEALMNATRKSGRSMKATKSPGDIARAKKRRIKQRLKRGLPFKIGESVGVDANFEQ